ncbi:MAG: pyruvate kinase [Ferroplasma sp.]|uniref:pyruvate kinase n=1 Tax=Ferroplasma sp. TaxID=2591003 RepID=UPI0028150BF4|nr:pyruvate kinase [Ferroplasma sp.]WMT51749.1 MAG: pyruvate kinase [Ferroplasma sp.]
MTKTKIVATIGPASFNESTIIKMADKGLSTVRINTAHIDPGYITDVSKMIYKINSEHNRKLGVMVDLKGPELRTGKFPGGTLNIDAGKIYTISDVGPVKSDISINYKISSYLDKDTVIAINDGRVRFNVVSLDNGIIKAKSMDNGVIHDRSRVNIPGKYIELGVLTDRDKLFIEEGLKNNVNFYALSFVQSRENVYELQDYIFDKKGQGDIISKIETKSGYDSIESIVKVSDFIMVARGDLGVELPLKEVAMAQKRIINISHKYAVPTIVATQMLESMVNSDSPTRAEVSDVTNAILDDTDALMLSEETAMGKYPVEAVTYLYEISKYVESQFMSFPEPENFMVDPIAFSVAKGVKIMSSTIDVNSIIALTISGHTAKIISAIRPVNDIYAVVQSEWLARSLNLMKGVIPVVLPREYAQSENIYEIISKISPLANLKPGEKTIVVSGSPSFYLGGTNNIRVLSIGTFIGRGYPAGKSITGKIDIDRSGQGNIIILDRYDSSIDFSKYDAAIIKSDVTNRIIDTFMQAGKTLVYNTELVSEIKTGSTISIDADTGIITCI